MNVLPRMASETFFRERYGMISGPYRGVLAQLSPHRHLDHLVPRPEVHLTDHNALPLSPSFCEHLSFLPYIAARCVSRSRHDR
jgi:hypothetical protein